MTASPVEGLSLDLHGFDRHHWLLLIHQAGSAVNHDTRFWMIVCQSAPWLSGRSRRPPGPRHERARSEERLTGRPLTPLRWKTPLLFRLHDNATDKHGPYDPSWTNYPPISVRAVLRLILRGGLRPTKGPKVPRDLAICCHASMAAVAGRRFMNACFALVGDARDYASPDRIRAAQAQRLAAAPFPLRHIRRLAIGCTQGRSGGDS